MSISKDERERAIFHSRRMYQTDLESNLATAEERGKRTGKAEVALNMIFDGEPEEKIIRYTGLTHDEINDLLKPH
jgi:predicted transposase/invertase (TIGR01784 family)